MRERDIASEESELINENGKNECQGLVKMLDWLRDVLLYCFQSPNLDSLHRRASIRKSIKIAPITIHPGSLTSQNTPVLESKVARLAFICLGNVHDESFK